MKALLDVAREGGWLIVTSVSHERRNLFLRFELFPAPAGRMPPAWLVSCRQVREFSLTDFDGGGLNLWTKSHPLLSQFSSPKASLKIPIGGRTRAECIGTLFQTHRQLVDDWIEFERFVPARVSLGPDPGSITVAGPEFLLAAYQRRLEETGFRPHFKKHRRALYWSGFGWSERRHTVSLLHFGKSFIVAESFSVESESTRHVRPNKRLQPSAAGAIMSRRG